MAEDPRSNSGEYEGTSSNGSVPVKKKKNREVFEPPKPVKK